MSEIEWSPHRTIPQDPDAVLDYVVEFHRYLGADTIASASLEADGCTADIKESDARSVTLRVSAVAGPASVRIRITRASGQKDDRTLKFNSLEF